MELTDNRTIDMWDFRFSQRYQDYSMWCRVSRSLPSCVGVWCSNLRARKPSVLPLRQWQHVSQQILHYSETELIIGRRGRFLWEACSPSSGQQITAFYQPGVVHMKQRFTRLYGVSSMNCTPICFYRSVYYDPSTPRSSKWYFPPGFPPKFLYSFFTSPTYATCFVHLIRLDTWLGRSRQE